MIVLAALLVLGGAFSSWAWNRKDDWLRRGLERVVRDKLGGEVEFGELRLAPTRLLVEFTELRLRLDAERDPALELVVDSGRARLAWSGLPALAAGKIHLAELRLVAPEVSVRRVGRAPGGPPGGSSRPIDLRIDRFSARDGRLCLDDRPTSLNLDAEDVRVRAAWDPLRGELAGEVGLRASLIVPPLERRMPFELSGSLRWRRHDLELVDVVVQADGLRVTLDTSVRFSGERIIAGRGTIQTDLDRLEPWLGSQLPPIGGQLSGPFSWEADADGIRTRGTLEMIEPHFGRFRAESAAASVRYDGNRLELLDLRTRVFEGEVRGKLELDLGEATGFRADLEAATIDSASLLRWFGTPLPLAGRVTARLQLAGTAGERSGWHGEGSFRVDPSAAAGQVPLDTSGQILIHQGQVQIKTSALEVAGAGLEFEMDLELAAPESWRATMQGRTEDVGRTQQATLLVLDALGISVPERLREPAGGRGTVEAMIGRGQLDLALGLEQARVGSASFDRADLELRLADNRLDLQRLDLRSGLGRLGARGRFDLDPLSVRRLELEAEALDAAKLLALAGLDLPVEGSLDASLAVERHGGDLQGRGRVHVVDSGFRDEPLGELRAELSVSGDEVVLRPLTLAAPAGDLEGQLVWDVGEGSVSIRIEAAEIRLADLQSLAPLAARPEGVLGLSGTIDHAGGRLSGRLRLDCTAAGLSGRTLGALHGEVRLLDEAIEIRVQGTEEAGWSAEAVVGWRDPFPFDGRLELRDTLIELAEWDPGAWFARVTGSVESQGPLADPTRLRASAVVEHAELRRGVAHLSLAAPLHLGLHDRRIVATSPIRLAGPGSELTGTFAFDFAESQLEARLEGNADLALLTAALPEVRSSGRVELQLAAHGSPERPSVTGSIRGEDTRFRLLGIPQSLDRLSFFVRLDGQQATLEKLQARLGNGEIGARGSARLEGLQLGAYELVADLANVRLVYPEGFRGVYEGQVTLEGDASTTTIGGRLQMLRGIYREDFLAGSAFGTTGREYGPANQLPATLFLDLGLVADGNVWVRNDLAEIESGFEVHLGGSLRRPELTGRLWMLEGGKLRYRNVEYDLDSGSLDFFDIDRINPFLTLRARTTVKRYTVFLRIEGTADEFEYELTSDPSLSTQDIIALLTTGNTLEEMTGGGDGSNFTGDIAANYFAGALTGPFERQLEQLLGLEQVRIQPLLVDGQADPTTRITLAQNVREDVKVTFSTTVGGDEQQLYQVDWQATDRFRISARRDTLGGIGGDVFYVDRFWWNAPPPGVHSPDPASDPVLSVIDPPISSILIRGASANQLSALRSRLPLRVGDEFTRSAMFGGVESIKRFYIDAGHVESQVLASSTTDASGTHVAYDIEPGPPAIVTFEGLTKREQRRIRPRLRELWIETVFNEDVYDDSIDLIRRIFEERGYYAADVRREKRLVDGRQEMHFIVDRGGQVRVEAVKIEGVEQLSEERLRSQMLTRPRRVLLPDVLDADVAAMRALCLDEGFLTARIDAPRVLLATSGETAEIVVRLEEGPRFTVRRVGFPEAMPIDEPEMHRVAAIEIGQIFSPTGLLEAESRLRTGFDRRGFPEARVRSEVLLEQGQADVVFIVDPGKFMRAAEVEIVGNHLTQSKVIRRELEIEPGDVISREKLLVSQRQLYSLGIFRNVRLSFVPIEGDDTAAHQLEVRVEENAPFSTSFGVGYDSEERARFSFTLTHDNVGGADRTVSLQGKYSSLERRLQLVGREPRIFNTRYNGVVNFGYQRQEELGFTTAGPSIALRMGREFTPKWGGFARYSFSRVDLSNVTLSPEEIEAERLVEGRLGSLGFGAARDSRDSPFSTREGSYITAGVNLFAKPLLSEFNFLKTTINGAYTIPVRSRTTFASSMRITFAIPYGSDGVVPISEALFAGGDTTVRGFARDTLGPPSGGEAWLILNAEVRYPIWRSLRGVAFYDAGNVYLRVSDFDPTDLRQVLGAGLRLELPIGPIRLEYGHKLDREPGESSGELFLSIGSAF